MKNIIIPILFIITIFNNNYSYSQDYSKYFESVAMAEVSILDSNYKKAIRIYKNTFRQYDFVFPKDTYIAAQVATYLADDSSCLYFLHKGVENGLPVESINKNPHLSKWMIRLKPNQLSTSTKDSLITQTYNNKYRDTIISLVKEDQRLRDKCETFLNSVVFNHKLKPRLYKKWMKQAETQSKIILEYTKLYGFPSHKTIGTHRKSDYSKFGTNFSSNYAFIILAHYDFAFQMFEKVFPEQLKKGNITPKQVALIRDFATRSYMFGDVEDKSFQDYKYFIKWIDNKKELIKSKDLEKEIESREKLIQENIIKINNDRKEIGLIPLQYQDKMKKNQILFNQNFEILKIDNLPYFDFNYWSWD